jgi:D-alanine-D-alanine ligase
LGIPRSGVMSDTGKTPLEDLLDPDWWRRLFGQLYLKTDSDIVCNEQLTKMEVDMLVELLDLNRGDRILDLCCGNGRHSVELAKRGYRHVYGLDYSKDLLNIARERVREEGLDISFRWGDARHLPYPDNFFDAVIMMGNSFGYFEDMHDDLLVLKEVKRVLRPFGKFLLDLVDGDVMRRSFERLGTELHSDGMLVMRERELSRAGDRLITREMVFDRAGGIVADNVYAVRLYSFTDLKMLMERAGFTGITFKARIAYEPEKNDPGMMKSRIVVTAFAAKDIAHQYGIGGRFIAVLLGDPTLKNVVKPGSRFDEDDMHAVNELKSALLGLRGYRFVFLDNHATLLDFLRERRNFIYMVLNLCDDGFLNNPRMELHIPALLDMLGIRYTGAGPRCLSICYDKSAIKSIASSMGIPVPHHIIIADEENAKDVRPPVFPAIVKPNFGDNSWGIDSHSVVRNMSELGAAVEDLRTRWGYRGPILVEEYLEGIELTFSILGNPPDDIALPILAEDYSLLPDSLPKILTYKAKWDPNSEYGRVRSKPIKLPPSLIHRILRWSRQLFKRLECRDYARFDWRLGSDGVPRLLEVNPNPGWVWDGHFRKACRYLGWSYSRMLAEIIHAAERRYSSEITKRVTGQTSNQL